MVHGSTKHQPTTIQDKLDLAVLLRKGTVFPTEQSDFPAISMSPPAKTNMAMESGPV